MSRLAALALALSVAFLAAPAEATPPDTRCSNASSIGPLVDTRGARLCGLDMAQEMQKRDSRRDTMRQAPNLPPDTGTAPTTNT